MRNFLARQPYLLRFSSIDDGKYLPGLARLSNHNSLAETSLQHVAVRDLTGPSHATMRSGKMARMARRGVFCALGGLRYALKAPGDNRLGR